MRIILKCLVVVILLVNCGVVNAEKKRARSSNGLSVPKGLEGRVEFWKLIFAKYGKNHRVFHNRSHPEIIYSVLDFSEFEAKLEGKDFLRAKEQEILREEEHISKALQHLASGKKPRGDFEERIYRLYKKLPNFSVRMFKEGLEADQIRYQTGIMERFRESLVRSGRYLKAIEHIFVEEGLPPEIGRLPFVESSFDYKAYSSVGAAGIWQFMPATAKKYMKVGSTIDERRDPIIASRSAAKYLKNSYKNTNSWPLAITSYNHGLTGILRAAKAVGSNNIVDIIDRYDGKSFGFASGNFYAEFLAALEIEQHVDLFFPGLVRDEAVEFEEIVLPKSMNIKTIAKYSKSSVGEIAELNLGFLSRIVENRSNVPSGMLVKLPVGGYRNFAKNISSTSLVANSRDFKSYLYDTVLTTSPISTDLPKSEVAEVDHEIESTDSSDPSTEVIVLGEQIGVDSKRNSDGKSERTAIVVKKQGNKLKNLSKKKKVETKSKINLKNNRRSAYKVVSGDSYYSIAKKLKIKQSDLVKANGGNAKKALKPGQLLRIP